MDRYQFLGLWIAAGLVIILSALPVSAEKVVGDRIILEYETGEINLTENSTASYNETEVVENELNLGFQFLESMLRMLDLNLNLINETLYEHSKEYPFLHPAIEGTATGIGAVDSAIVVAEDPANMSNANSTLNIFDGSIADLNASLVYPQDMLDAANATLGQPEATTPILENMYRITKAMVTIYDNA
ncbi:MAG TPA: hypothetical protein HA261_06510 [Methanosarcina sp.]|nr:hypothetical protein [Methanosarcina sp.]